MFDQFHWWHIAAIVGAYIVGVSSNVVATVVMHWAQRATGKWWLVP